MTGAEQAEQKLAADSVPNVSLASFVDVGAPITGAERAFPFRRGFRSFANRYWRRTLATLLAVIVAWTVFNQIGRLDMVAVRSALALLHWWQLVILFGLLLLRQVSGAFPMVLYINGLSIPRATQNDLAAITASLVAPGPADYALRVAMFQSWGISGRYGAAGAALKNLTFYIVRYATPLAGFAILLVYSETRIDIGYRWGGLLSIAAALAILTVLLLVVRSDQFATRIATWAAKVVGRLPLGTRKADPNRWAMAAVGFRRHIAARFRRFFPLALLASATMVATDFLTIMLALRFVGVGPAQASLSQVAIAYTFAFPLTLMPYTGIGVVDALIVASLVQTGGIAIEAPVVAALFLWRIVTIGGSALAGAGAFLWWRAMRHARLRRATTP